MKDGRNIDWKERLMYRLHCFSQSGNSFKVAFFLRALKSRR